MRVVLMRSLFIAMLTTALVAAVGVRSAQAAPVRDCGNITAHYNGQTVTIMRNVTVRGESCVTARSAARHMPFGGFGSFTQQYRGYTCRVRPVEPRRSWWVDVRCTQAATGWVMRWQY